MDKQSLPGLTPEETRKAVGWNRLVEVFSLLEDKNAVDIFSRDLWATPVAQTGVEGSSVDGASTKFTVYASGISPTASIRGRRNARSNIGLGFLKHFKRPESFFGFEEEYVRATDEFDSYVSQDGDAVEIIPSWSWYDGLTDADRKTVDDVVDSVYKEVTVVDRLSSDSVGLY